MIHQYRPFCPGGYILRISSDRDDRRVVFGFEKWQVSFLGSLILVGIFLDIQNNLKIRDSSCVSRPRSSANMFLWLENWAWDCFGFCLKP